MNPNDKSHLWGHICIGLACAIWGLMAPLGKDAMLPDGNHLTGITMVTFRVCGAALCFWALDCCLKLRKKIASRRAARLDDITIHAEEDRRDPPLRDILMLGLAGMFGIVFNQCNFTIGLSLTSPVHASIMTTTMPIVTMAIGVIFLHERITWTKILGIILGIVGALILILGAASGASVLDGSLLGDVMVIGAQCSFACYLTLFGRLIKRYDTITCMKWMMLWAAMAITPFTWRYVAELPWQTISLRTWAEAFFVVFFGTFLGYICMMYAQKALKPTVVAMYNYVQPIVACLVSVILGLGVFGPLQGLAVLLVFSGVWLVSKKKH